MSTPSLPAALVALAALPLGACTSNYEVRLSEASSIRPGANVVLAGGDSLELRDTFGVRATPFPGAVFVPQRENPAVFRAEPGYDARKAANTGPTPWGATPWVQPPARLGLMGQYLVLQDAKHRIFIDATSVRYLEVEQKNPGKTAAIVLGAGIPGTLVGVVLVALTTVAFTGGWGTPVY